MSAPFGINCFLFRDGDLLLLFESTLLSRDDIGGEELWFFLLLLLRAFGDAEEEYERLRFGIVQRTKFF